MHGDRPAKEAKVLSLWGMFLLAGLPSCKLGNAKSHPLKGGLKAKR